MSFPDHIVEAQKVKKIYDLGSAKVEALRGVDIVVQPQEFVGIMGPSGSGKSTLMYILGCLERPTEGTYLLSGQDTSFFSDHELSGIRATRVGFIFQTFNLIPQYTVEENVAMPFLYREEAETEVAIRVERAIERVGLSARRNHRPSELSGGEMQRAAIARALVVEPLLILADEPTGNLDSKTSDGILLALGELNRQGTTIILVTHDEKVASHCRRIVHLHDGRILGDEVRQ